MQVLFRSLLFFNACFLFVLNFAHAEEVRVRLKSDQKRLIMNVFDLDLRGETRRGWSRLEMTLHPGCLKWTLTSKQTSSASCESSLSFELRARLIRSGGENLPGHLRVQASKAKNFEIIAHVPLEDYVKGVVAGEMPRGWPLEALKAQAVAARSYVLAVKKSRARLPFDVEGSMMDQVFRFEESHDPRIKQAVQETAGLVLIDQQQKVAKAFFHADCGGQTASEKSVWGSSGETVVVTDSTCPNQPRFNWKFQASWEDLQQRLRPLLAANMVLKDVIPLYTSTDLRAHRIRLVGQRQNEALEVPADLFRRALGYGQLKSTRFQLERRAEGLFFKGSGWGHGVGLCQWGTRALAMKGLQARQILAHYYPRFQLASSQTSEPKRTPGQEQ